MPVYSNLTSCGSCLSYGYFWILHFSGIQDCWDDMADIDDLSHATEPGQSCADIFENLGCSHWGYVAWIQMFVSIFIGCGFHASFQVVYDRYGKYGPMNPRYAGFSGFFRFLCAFMCSWFGYAGAGLRVPLLPNEPGSTETLSSVATTSTRLPTKTMKSYGTQTVAGEPGVSVAVGTTPPPPVVGSGSGAAAVIEESSINTQVTPPASTSTARHVPVSAAPSSTVTMPPPDLPQLHSPASTSATPASSPPVLSVSSRSMIPVAIAPPPRRQAAIESEKKTRQMKKQI